MMKPTKEPATKEPATKKQRPFFKLVVNVPKKEHETELALFPLFPTVTCSGCEQIFQPFGVGASMECPQCGTHFCLWCSASFTPDRELEHFCPASIGVDCFNFGCGHLDDPATCRFNFSSEEALQDFVRRPHMKKLTLYNLTLIFVEAKKPWDDKKYTGGPWRCQPLAKYAHYDFLWDLVCKFLF